MLPFKTLPSLGFWDTTCSWFSSECSGSSFLSSFAGSSFSLPSDYEGHQASRLFSSTFTSLLISAHLTSLEVPFIHG